MKTLIGTVGYYGQRDLSAGPLLLPRLQGEPWPPGVVVEDLSYDPIAFVHRMNEEDPLFDRLILVGAMDRGHPEVRISWYRWQGRLPPAEEVQQRIGEALSGVVDLENLLVIGQQFGALPAEVFAVEVQPMAISHGLEPSPELEARLPGVVDLVRQLASSSEPGAILTHQEPVSGRETWQ